MVKVSCGRGHSCNEPLRLGAQEVRDAVSIPCAAFCRHASLASSTVSRPSRMLPHSMNTFGTVDRLRPQRSLCTSRPVPPPT
jgi:hypothetical protein